MAIMIMMEFSINVASVMGNFNAVPKQAHRIDFLSKSVFVTPTVVIPRMTNVIHNAIVISYRIKNIRPNAVSIKGYTFA
jgi:hypothetical protein